MAKGGDKNNPMAAMMGGMGAMGMPNPMAAAAEEPKEKDKPLTWKDTWDGAGRVMILMAGEHLNGWIKRMYNIWSGIVHFQVNLIHLNGKFRIHFLEVLYQINII